MVSCNCVALVAVSRINYQKALVSYQLWDEPMDIQNVILDRDAGLAYNQRGRDP